MRIRTAVASLFLTVSIHGASYYVATTGHDDARGTVEQPFRTITRAAQAVRAGDEVIVRGGVYTKPVTISARGMPSAPIIFRAMSGEKVALDGGGIRGETPIVALRASAYVDFSGFEVRNSPFIGIVVWESRHIRVLGNHVHHTERNGIYAGADELRGNSDITISRNSVHDAVRENRRHDMKQGGWAGAVVVSKTLRATVSDNRIWNNDGEGVIALRSKHVLIRGNEIFDNFSAYLYVDNARFVTGDGNLIYSTGNARYFRDGQPGAGIAVANETKDIEYPSSDNLFINNVVVGTRWGFYYGNYQRGGGLRNTKVLNNTFYATTEEIVRIEEDRHANTLIAHNVFYQARSRAPRHSGGRRVTFRNNTWYGDAGAAAGPGDVRGIPPLENPLQQQRKRAASSR